MKRKKTKKALSGSILALVLCFVMLIGTTFAWFTSSDSTAVNKIEAGTLNVQLLGEDGNDLTGDGLTWQKNTSDTRDTILWEPGATFETQKFKIANTGNLALKYEILVSGATGDTKLLDVIDFKIVDSTDTTKSVDLAGFTGNLKGNETSGLYYIEATMQTSAGNEYQNKTLDKIAITVVATQDTVEYDSNDNRYDADATLPDVNAVPAGTETALDTALANGGSAYMTTNMTVSNRKTGPGTNNVYYVAAVVDGGTLDGGAHILGIADTSSSAIILTSGGTIKNVTLSDAAGWGIFIQKPTQDVILDGVTISGSTYSINTGNPADSGDLVKLIASNSVFNGWTSFANIESASFTNCSFGSNPKSNNTSYDGLFKHGMRPFVPATYTNCSFEEGYIIDACEGKSITLMNCTCNGVVLTANNFSQYIKVIASWGENNVINYATVDTLPTTVTFG